MLEVSLEEARGKHVLAALSGGADSVALLLILCKGRDQGMLTLSAAHFEHGIRGADSLADASFCEKLCRDLGVPLYLEHADVPGESRSSGEGLESCARRLRHDFLKRTARMIHADLIALAHHMDDQAETVLMHLLRGAGPEGACGMSRRSGMLYRPLLDARKEELTEFLISLGQAWREDATNVSLDTPRNRLRLEAIPALRAVYPGTVRALARFSGSLRVENEYLKRQAEDFARDRVSAFPGGWRIDLSGRCEEALLRRTIRTLLGQGLPCEKMEELISLTGECEVSGGFRAMRRGEEMFLWKRLSFPEMPLDLEGETVLPGLCRVKCESWEEEPEKKLRSTQVLNRLSLSGACLRTRRQGDWIRPFGMEGRKSLSDYMTDGKIALPLRDLVPVVARGSEILWVIGFGISAACALRGEGAVRLVCEYIGWGGFEP